jgi:hypothetical protein
MTAKNARIMLQNLTLRWSTPIEFNDPFDIPGEVLFGIDASEIQKASLQYLLDLMKDPPEEINDFKPKLRLILEAIKKADADTKSEIIKCFESVAGQNRKKLN